MLNMITLSSSEKGMKIRTVLVQLGQQIVVVPTPHELILQLFKLCDAIPFVPQLIFPIWKRIYQTISSCEHRECRDFWSIRYAAPADPPWKKLTIFERNCNMSEGGLECPHLWETGMHCEHEKLDLVTLRAYWCVQARVIMFFLSEQARIRKKESAATFCITHYIFSLMFWNFPLTLRCSHYIDLLNEPKMSHTAGC
jgi:hypothetical protein